MAHVDLVKGIYSQNEIFRVLKDNVNVSDVGAGVFLRKEDVTS